MMKRRKGLIRAEPLLHVDIGHLRHSLSGSNRFELVGAALARLEVSSGPLAQAFVEASRHSRCLEAAERANQTATCEELTVDSNTSRCREEYYVDDHGENDDER